MFTGKFIKPCLRYFFRIRQEIISLQRKESSDIMKNKSIFGHMHFEKRRTLNGLILTKKESQKWLNVRHFHMRGLYKSHGSSDHKVHEDKWPYCMRSLSSCICTELTQAQPLGDLLCFTDCCASYLYDAPWWMEFWHDYRRLNT